jgi:hypothetical protein
MAMIRNALANALERAAAWIVGLLRGGGPGEEK